MKYRAKITNIRSFIEARYGISRPICKDDRDWYIEVNTEDEVIAIENINNAQRELNETIKRYFCLIGI